MYTGFTVLYTFAYVVPETVVFYTTPGVVGATESESEVGFLIPPSPKLLTVKLKTPPGPPPICI